MGVTRNLFEIVPSSKMSSEESREKTLDVIASALSGIKSVDLINVPEIIEENHLGVPYYRNIDNLAFSQKLSQRTKKDTIINKVVAHFNSSKEFVGWLDNAVSAVKIKNFIFVGGNKSSNRYNGPSVTEANRIAVDFSINVGNIALPSRKGEADRMFQKTLSGASFFTTQVLFSSKTLETVLESYHYKCAENRLKPSKIFLSFCCVSRPSEMEFIKWLGAEVPADVEKRILSDSNRLAENSIKLAKDVFDQIKNFNKESGIRLDLGLNVENIFFHSLKSTVDLLEHLL